MMNDELKTGDIVRAIPNSIADIFAEGRKGVIVDTLRHDKHGSLGSNLVVWGNDGCHLGFRPAELIKQK